MTETPRRRGSRPRLLTQAELEIMTVLWRLGEGTVHQVREGLPAGRRLAYTSVSTILRILEQKHVVGSRREGSGRGHTYFPRVPKEEYEARSLRDLIGRVFDGAPLELVRCLVENESLSPRDMAAMRALLEESDRGKRRG
jgi:BlaI family transcriptional regulator, penicillinase repressor